MSDNHAAAQQHLEKCLNNKARWRQQQAKLSFAEKIAIVDKLKDASALFAPLRARHQKIMDKT